MGGFAQECEQKENARYRNEALTASGRHSMAGEYCRSATRLGSGQRLHLLANEHGTDSAPAARAISTCMEAQSRINSALTAAKDDETIQFMLNGCKYE
jgi:hypothetical protein